MEMSENIFSLKLTNAFSIIDRTGPQIFRQQGGNQMETLQLWWGVVKQFWLESGNRLHFIIGSDSDTILWWQMCIRGIVIFFYALFLVRIGGTRIFGKNTSFDIVLGVILGSILSRALTANAKFIPTIAAAGTLILLHKLLASAAFRQKVIGHLIKGKETQLVQDGNILWKNMKKTSITEHDLKEALRSNVKTADLRSIKSAFIERSGKISFIT
jgi:hypothetical protein